LSIDGLAIASRLSKRIVTITKQMKQMLCGFNEGLPSESQMSWEAASNIHCHTYRASLTSRPGDLIPLEVKHEAVQKLKLLKRSMEEISLLKEEMKNCIDHFQQRIMSLQMLQGQILSEYNGDQAKLSGYHCLIAKKLFLNNAKLSYLQKLFKQSIPGMYSMSI